ncbi:MAG: hypothetical protein IIA02_05670 [Proteobacteria bacterium]|jgi:acyl-CoA reductase-like NAD-dependent aldehyde dehydrogenase|uniref:hypothetical protein n=1 Tax=Aquabacterium sp. TaxID=1872578 RepID=UPI0035C68D87|nr:hypothetical protein [Pseudomonadota bacterium]
MQPAKKQSAKPPAMTPEQEAAHKASLQKTKDRIAKLTPEQKDAMLKRWAENK